jgi:hypothetical protein
MYLLFRSVFLTDLPKDLKRPFIYFYLIAQNGGIEANLHHPAFTSLKLYYIIYFKRLVENQKNTAKERAPGYSITAR